MRMRVASPSLCASPQDNPGIPQKNTPFFPPPSMRVLSFTFVFLLKTILQKNPLDFVFSDFSHWFPVLLSSSSLKPISSHACCQSPLFHSFPFLTYIYHPSRPKFVSKKENSPISFLLLFFFF